MTQTPLYCPHFSRCAYALTGTKTAIFTRLRCKRWACEYCSKKNAAIWRAHLFERIPQVADVWYIMTLTAHSTQRTMTQSLANIRKGIDALIKRAKRVFGQEIEYVRVYEKHPTSQAVHAHFIISGLSPYVAIGCSIKLQPMAIGVTKRANRNGVWAVKSWLKKVCIELKIGYIADVQEITGPKENPVFYVTKYLTKSMQDIPIKGLRHVQTTGAIGSPKTEENPAWKTAAYITAYMFEPNTSIIDLNTGEVIDNRFWEVHGHYPYD